MEKKVNAYGGKPTCYVLIGPPGCGKSTWVKEHLKTACNPTHIASTDNIIEEIAASRSLTYSDVFKTSFKEADQRFKAELFEAARDNYDIIVDRTNMGAKARAKIGAWITSHTATPYRMVGVLFEWREDVLRERLERRAHATGKDISWGVVEGMLETYAEPTRDEFDLLTVVKL